ncbi:MAG: LD-carboxypeptidase [Flavobacterium sp. MedPE-SWcel]|uniref:S66 peptidase family protein n=1 Tax=uncultured Flavobacterium sp. TaxID=165435 RepID=UPI000910E0E9|nr:LD-carboxypeptidase [uncultured Flavobacterium sp.]OIQ19268.1 MAG: LD-carboxypeptidase [Flavobacterium sp. MedPE-SWcel]
MKTPAYLQKGDTIGILSTARKLTLDQLAPAIQLLESWGLSVTIGKTIGLDNNNQLAGTDEERAADFQDMIDNPNVKAIWCAKGGYGTVRMVDGVDFTGFKKNPKWLIGFSDVTVLHSHINNMNIPTLHSIMCLTMPSATPQAIDSLRMALFGEKLAYNIEPHPYNNQGTTQGELVGGNLSVLYSIIGSRSEVDYSDKILFIEDLDEYLYHIDRMMMNLERNRYFNKVKGIVIGGMSSMNDNTIPWGHDALEIIKDITAPYNIPICFNFPAGHIDDNRTLVLGTTITLNVNDTDTTITFD